MGTGKAFENARSTKDKPTVIIAKTSKGRGVSFLDGKSNWHGKPVKKEDLEKALAELKDEGASVKVAARTVGDAPKSNGTFSVDDPALAPNYKKGDMTATRNAYGEALVKLGKVCKDVVALDAEVKNSTFAEPFKNAYPDRFVECFIAEQNMAGAALGLASEGKIPFSSTFACFLSRAYDQIRMAGYSRPKHLIFAGSHVGVSIGPDGPSQMGAQTIMSYL